MKVKCSNCLTEDEASKMIEINTGRVQYLCWDCYKKGHSEAHIAEVDRAKRISRYEHIYRKK